MNATIVEALYEWFDESEALNADIPLQVDYLDEQEPAYSIQIIPCTPTLRRYADGSEKRQYLFVFAMRAPYGESSAVNMRNLAFFERLEQWIGMSTPELPTERGRLSIKSSAGFPIYGKPAHSIKIRRYRPYE